LVYAAPADFTDNEQTKVTSDIQMKTNNIVRLLLGALFSLAIIVPAKADSMYEIYTPITTAKQAHSIKPGTRIAYICGACGAVTTMKADKNGKYLHGFTCPGCKRKFVMESIGGNAGSVSFSYLDDSGNHAKLLVMH